MTTTDTKTRKSPSATPSPGARKKPPVRTGRPRPAAGETDETANEVRLVGRLSSAPAVVDLPSGDALLTFRVSVPRPASTSRASGPASAQRVDSIPCTVWTTVLRRRVLTWRPGDTVEVSGAVRCRFYQAGGATRSRVEVEVSSARIIRRAPGA